MIRKTQDLTCVFYVTIVIVSLIVTAFTPHKEIARIASREPTCSSPFPYGTPKSKNPKTNCVRFRILLVTRTGAFASLKEIRSCIGTRIFPNPMGSPDGSGSKKAQGNSCAFLLVTRTGLEPMLPP